MGYYSNINNTTNGSLLYINNIGYYSNINNTINGSHCILTLYVITVTLITQLMVTTVY